MYTTAMRPLGKRFDDGQREQERTLQYMLIGAPSENKRTQL